MTRTVWSAILILSIALIDVALFALGLPGGPWLGSSVGFGLLAGQSGLAATWLVLSGSPSWPKRLSIIAVFVLALAAVTGTSAVTYWTWAVLHAGLVVLNVIALTSVQVLGMRAVDRRPADEPSAAGTEYTQTSIRDIMILTAAVGVIAAATVYVPPRLRGTNEIAVVLQFAICFAAVTVISVIATLAFDRVVLWVMLGLAASAGCGYSLARALNEDRDRWLIITMAVAAATFQIGVLSSYRGLGFRFCRSRLATPPPESVPT